MSWEIGRRKQYWKWWKNCWESGDFPPFWEFEDTVKYLDSQLYKRHYRNHSALTNHKISIQSLLYSVSISKFLDVDLWDVYLVYIYIYIYSYCGRRTLMSADQTCLYSPSLFLIKTGHLCYSEIKKMLLIFSYFKIKNLKIKPLILLFTKTNIISYFTLKWQFFWLFLIWISRLYFDNAWVSSDPSIFPQ